MIRRALILDTETTGLDPQKDSVIEYGMILYSIEHATSLVQYSALNFVSENPAESINGIPAAATQIKYDNPTNIETVLNSIAAEADVIVAHNAEFDRAFCRNAPWYTKPWLCTMSDFRFPRGKQGDSLINLALAHGIGVSSAHRALTDCRLIADMFDRMPLFGFDLQAMFAHAMRPSAMFRALVSFDQKELAKDAGFKWDPTAEQWFRKMALADVEALPFRCARV